MRQLTIAAFIAAAPGAAQQSPPLTADDYARAERFLGARTAPLVSGIAGPPTWLADGRFWYRTTTDGGAEFITVDPARRTRAAAFDHTRLAAALASATGGRIEAAALPFQGFELSKDGREITVTGDDDRRWTCSIQEYTCAPADTTRASFAAPPASVTSPDGKYAAYIRDFNLWVKDLGTNQDRALTTDGVADFGYRRTTPAGSGVTSRCCSGRRTHAGLRRSSTTVAA